MAGGDPVTSQLLTTAQTVGITGEEDPLAPADIRFILERAYTPWQAALMLRGPRTAWGREHARPAHKGGAGRRDGVWLCYGCDARGIHARITVYDADDRPISTVGGLVAWRDAEHTIREAATPATLAALHAAVDAYRAHHVRRPETKPGGRGAPYSAEDAAEGGRLVRAEAAAWRALIRAAPAEQLDLFTEVT